MRRALITDFAQAQFLLNAPVFVVDIETNTNAPSDEWPEKAFGTSFVTEITTVAFYVPGHAPVALDVRGYPQDVVDFIREVFTNRSDYTVIGHYVVFDIRSLGGHFGFQLPRGVRVWDTKVMSGLLLFGEPEKGGGQLSLRAQVELANLFADEDDRAFYAEMKDYRGNLHDLAEVLRKAPSDSVLWRYTRGYPRYDDKTLPSADVDQEHYLLTGQEITDLSGFDLTGHAQDILEQYAAMDVIFPYDLYRLHKDFIDRVSKGNAIIRPGIVVPKWPAVVELVDWETKISWVSCNLAARGVDLDANYARTKQKEWHDEMLAEIDEVLQLPDPSDPYDEWRQDFQMILWWSRLLDGVAARGTFSDVTRYEYWQFQQYPDLDASILQFRDSVEHEDVRRQEWVAWLLGMTPDVKRAAAIKSRPEGWSIPSIDVVEWVRQTCFADRDLLVGQYLAKLKTDWFSKYYTSTKPIPNVDIVNSGIWKPYHLFVVCEIDLPNEEEIHGEADLTTDSFRRMLADLEERAKHDPSITIDELGLALRTGTLAKGKKAIEYYLKRFKLDLGLEENDEIPDDATPTFTHYAKLMQAEANYNRATEFLLHASRDGKIHSVIDRGARTGRYASGSPNLQNIAVKTFKGFLIPPAGYTLVELDYANAENKMGAMIASDDAFAFATEIGDFHMQMLRAYIPQELARLEEAGDWEKVKELRTFYKRVTFAIPYGAGPRRIARTTKKSFDEAKRIIDARKAAFPNVERKKKEVIDNLMQRWNKGYRPAYVPLWTGRRVIVPTGSNGDSEYVISYTTWNYLQQGGVAEMVARSKVLAYEMLLSRGYQTYIVLNVHDSIILAVKHEEWPDVVQEVIQIMCSQVPAELRQRTVPAVHFVTEVGPENAVKWGWQSGKEYPFSLEHFVNQWGYHRLPDKELEKDPKKREAPTWVGPVHEGWTLQQEIDEERARRARMSVADESVTAAVENVGQEWYDLQRLFDSYDQLIQQMYTWGVQIKPHRMPAKVKYIQPSEKGDDLREVGPFAFPERMVAMQALTQKGHNLPSYQEAVTGIKNLLTMNENLLQFAQAVKEWHERYGEPNT